MGSISVRRARAEVGLSQKGLAEKAGVSLSELMLLERGFAPLSTSHAEALAEALGSILNPLL
ncbi:helix-turn-helix transcriptional regulator [Novosphingobium sp.]|uniref:helix-turn-helix domain-containing protein n=1 Tax=Novosphingobium sp. TaxID=1874826 RepID=UPI001EB70822|nr:helix-turn-helix transcriptional regulator [Novosphingobium sp.]